MLQAKIVLKFNHVKIKLQAILHGTDSMSELGFTTSSIFFVRVTGCQEEKLTICTTRALCVWFSWDYF